MAVENFKISPVPLLQVFLPPADRSNPSIEIPSKLLPSSTTSRPNCFKSSPDILVVFQLQLIAYQNLYGAKNIFNNPKQSYSSKKRK
jgi:hypothetical protein